MTNRELLEFTLKVNIGTCNEIYTKIDRQLEEKSDINPKHLAFTKDDEIVEIEVEL